MLFPKSLLQFFINFPFCIAANSPFKKLKSKEALWIISFLSLIKSKNSSEISSNVSLSLKNSSENRTLNASSAYFFWIYNFVEDISVGIKSLVSIQAISTTLCPSLKDRPVVSVSKKFHS